MQNNKGPPKQKQHGNNGSLILLDNFSAYPTSPLSTLCPVCYFPEDLDGVHAQIFCVLSNFIQQNEF